MKMSLGQYTEQYTGVIKDRYLIFGFVVKNAEFGSVGKKAMPRLTFAVSVGRNEDLCNMTMWGDLAVKYRDIRKGDNVIVDALEQQKEYNGKVYVSYLPMNIIVGRMEDSTEAAPVPPPPMVEETFGEGTFVDIDERTVFG